MQKIIFLISILFGLTFVPSVFAQGTTYWSSCSDGATIVRCETYNCPNGDTNGDGRCTAQDRLAEMTESRNDSFCANPQSGCGEVLYYASNQKNSCAIRVKENTNNCDLYKASTPNFGSTATPVATVSPTVAPVSRLSTVSPSATPISTPKNLPKTGPALWISMFIAGIGVYGFHHYGKGSHNKED